jgi:NRPS condensation-like uncharacterized protein
MCFGDVLTMFRGLRHQAVAQGLASPYLSNFGEVSKTELKFQETEVADAYMVPPIMFSPGFMPGASAYRETLTLMVGVYESTVEAETVETFLNRMANELRNVDCSG